ncbi:MAG: DUF2283 domain-containing protein [Candidatus Woesearchaeota archaeon]
MFRKFKFDYDKENDSLFLYDPKSKSKASVEVNDMIIDYNGKKEVTGIELLDATKLLKELSFEKSGSISLGDIKECQIEIINKHNFFIIKILLIFLSRDRMTTPILVPRLTESSPALYA